MADRKTLSKDTFKVSINSAARLMEACTKLTEAFRQHKYLVISVRPGKDRSLDQNQLWFGMYKRVAQTLEQGDQEEIRAYCKLMFGVPIMRRDDERFAAGWARYFQDKPFAEQLFLMGANPLFGPDGFPVTRLFGTKQGCEYTDAIADYYVPKGVFFGDMLEDVA
jgi:hypothetical protein